jgi:aminobenzoyl-glutamate utilization protein B
MFSAEFLVSSFGLAAALATSSPQQSAPGTDSYLEQTRAQWDALAQRIWETPEVALQEKKSSAALAEVLKKEGFQVTWGSGGQPTAFIATVGSGSPVIGYVAEYDALPQLSQAAGKPKKEPLAESAPGHACGHNLLGAASVAAAIAANKERTVRKLAGTIQVFGTPAEEVLFGKTFMIRDGAFKKTDAMLTWHPSTHTRIINRARLAATSVDVEFFGRSSHAASSPWLGRSALDALTLFDHAMALMREHVKPTARIHRIVKEGGAAANIIPDHTRGEYWVREATADAMNEIIERLRKAADGAALATETRAQVRVRFSVRDPVPNDVLDAVVQKQLERVGPPRFDTSEVQFAKAMQKELGVEPAGLFDQVMPYAQKNGDSASSDIGEVSALVPLAELNVATRPLGTAAHHWATTSSAGHSVGRKGMQVAAKVLAAAGVDLLADPALVKSAKEEFVRQTKGKPYVSPLPPDAKVELR